MNRNEEDEKSYVTEREQGVLRITGVSLFAFYALYLAHTGRLSDQNVHQLMLYGMLYLPVTFLIYFTIVRDIFVSRVRRYLGIIIDIGSITICLILFSEYGMPLFVVYLWVIIGNGFRYGFRELVFCTFLSTLGFLIVVNLVPYWINDVYVAAAGFMLLSMIPFYIGILLKRLQKEKERAEIANLEKSRFLANVSHELRTPLNAVIGFSELLGNPDSQVSQQRLVGGIKNSARSLLSLVEGVLDFSRIETGRVDLVEKLLDLHALIESVCAMFLLEAERKGLTLLHDINHEVPRYILGDEHRLRQVLVNLIGNAIKFTDVGEIRVRVEKISGGCEGMQVRFVIDDTGIGISEDARPYVFERFRQVDDSAQRHYGGAGLGTAISRHLVEAMGGEIGLESQYGKGSRFWFTLPCKVPCVTTQESDSTTGEMQSLVRKKGQPLRVLVAEDSEINREVFAGQFAILGVTPLLVDSGDAALDAIAKKDVDVMILDIQMPGMSGLDVIREYYQRTDARDRVPIIVITGDATEDIRAECNQLGVHSFLAKPVALDKLHALLLEYADHRKVTAIAG